MYEAFFGLTGNPFGMTPDPGFYFRSESHREALAALEYGVRERRGFMTLVGEVGTGKTTLLNTLLEALDRSTCTIQVRHTTVDREELLKLILNNLYASHGPRQPARKNRDTGLFTDNRLSGLSRAELINEFNAFVTGEFMAYQPPPLLIIDEAQNLAPDVLEEVRLLTNLEDPKSKMLQVILAGQPELEGVLLRSDLRQLRQRIAVNARLEPLTLDETGDYVSHRLEKAGCVNDQLFSRAALKEIWSASKGTPRTINVLCDHALINAFASGLVQVDASSAQEAIQDVLCLRSRRQSVRKPRPYLVADFESHRDSPAEPSSTAAGDQSGGSN
jgi:type II secretory pathway predicted ATPase ExeA